MEPIKEPSTPLVLLSSSPHIHSGHTVPAAMREVILALVPAVLASFYYFRMSALSVILACVISAMVFEAICQKLMNRPITTYDCSAALTGLLLALCLPPSFPISLAIMGSFFAIVIGKMVFGGLGCNVFNPAHLGRAILLASYPQQMTTWVLPVTASTTLNAVTSATMKADAVSSATPLVSMRIAESLWQTGQQASTQLPSLWNLFIGNVGGSLGETCVPALLVGGLFLIWRGHVDWRVPFFYLATVAVITGIYGGVRGYDSIFPLYHLLAGGLMIGSFFMATDWVTSPITKRGRIVYAIGLGVLTALIRLRGSYVEGVCYSILMMNMVTPLIDKYICNISFGGGAKK